MAAPAALAEMDQNAHGVRPPSARESKPRSHGPRRESDYQIVQKLTRKITTMAVAEGQAAQQAHARAERERNTTPKKVKPRKQLCNTPPVNLTSKHGGEYDRGRQLGEGGFARCFLAKNKEGEYFAVKTVSKESLQTEKMKQKVCL